MDNESDIQTPKKSKNPRKRRSSLFSRRQSNGDANAIPDLSSEQLSNTSPIPPMGSRPRRQATWGDDIGMDSMQTIQSRSSDSHFIVNNQRLFENSDNEVTPMIPDLEEVHDMEMVQTMAEPPTAHNQIISFQELDKNLLKHSSFGSLDGIDLTHLTNFCLPESQVKEDDIPWSWDHIISDVTSKLSVKEPEV